MTDQDLIKQLTGYADAITGFSFVQALAFIYAVARGDGFSARVLRTDGAITATIGIVVGTGVYGCLVQECMYWAANLEAAKGSVAAVLHSLQIVRIAIVVTGGALSMLTLWLIKLGPKLRHTAHG